MKLLVKKNYLNTIKKSVGTTMFQNIFAEIGDNEEDIARNGQLSCAFFVSSILMLFHLIDTTQSPHSTVKGTLRNMEASEWKEIPKKELKEGDVIIWETITDLDGEQHEHIGFYVGDSMAVSNSSKDRVPQEHHYTYDGKRNIRSCWRSQIF